MRIAVVAIHPAPYREHILVRLSALPDVTLKVFYAPEMPHWEIPPGNYDMERLPPGRFPSLGGSYMLKYLDDRVFAALDRFAPDAIICYGYDCWPMQGAILWTQSRGVPLILRNDANYLEPRTVVQTVRRRMVGAAIRGMGARALAIGSANVEYWRREMNFQSRRIFWAPYTVDNEFFERGRAEWRPRRHELHDQWGVLGKRIFLYVGRLAPEKGLDTLLQAFRRVQAERPDTALVLIGRGAEQARLEAMAREANLSNVVFAGFVKPSDLPRYYAAADVFVLPSRHEPWALVVNEAMASGLPVVVSDLVGAWPDLVHEGVNGFVFPSENTAALAEAMLRALNGDSEGMGRRSREIVRRFSVERELEGFEKALRDAVPMKKAA